MLPGRCGVFYLTAAPYPVEKMIKIVLFILILKSRHAFSDKCSSLSVVMMNQIKTLVYFDIEATGLKSSGRPRITELSLVAVNLQDVLGKQMYSKPRSIICDRFVSFSF